MGFLNSNIWVIISFLAFTILVAVIASVKTKGDNLESADGYFLASRSLPGYYVMNLSLSHEFSLRHGKLGLGAYVNNLLNNMYIADGWCLSVWQQICLRWQLC